MIQVFLVTALTRHTSARRKDGTLGFLAGSLQQSGAQGVVHLVWGRVLESPGGGHADWLACWHGCEGARVGCKPWGAVGRDSWLQPGSSVLWMTIDAECNLGDWN